MFSRLQPQWNIQFRNNNILIKNSLFDKNNAKLLPIHHPNVTINIFNECVFDIREYTVWLHPNKDIFMVMDDFCSYYEIYANERVQTKHTPLKC